MPGTADGDEFVQIVPALESVPRCMDVGVISGEKFMGKMVCSKTVYHLSPHFQPNRE
jgi:hypothetical protein